MPGPGRREIFQSGPSAKSPVNRQARPVTPPRQVLLLQTIAASPVVLGPAIFLTRQVQLPRRQEQCAQAESEFRECQRQASSAQPRPSVGLVPFRAPTTKWQ